MCETSNLDYRTILRNAQAKGIDPSLEPVQQMLRELGDPDLAFRAIQVAGTNGKTSTARYTAAILAGEGLKVGLYLSPMLMDYLDQIEVEGQTIDEVELSSAVIDAWQAGQRVNARREELGLSELPLTEFDLLTVAAVLVFCRRGVDVAVLEAGMGGQWDATSAVRSINTVGVTGIGLDHTRILGTTRPEIARNKAAVIQAGRACVLGPGTQSAPEVAEVFERRCAEQQVEPVIVGEDSAGAKNVDAIYKAEVLAQDKGALRVSVCTTIATYTDLQAIKPLYQAQNIACAVVLSQVFLGRTLNVGALRASVRECRTPGRFDMLRTDPLVLVDACHNPQSVQAFLDAWCSLYPNAIPTAHSAPTTSKNPRQAHAPTLLCAIFADKDVELMVAMLAEVFPRVVVTQTMSPRAMPAEQLARVFEAHGVCPEATFGNVEDAVSYLEERPFVACGSITTAGEVTACFA